MGAVRKSCPVGSGFLANFHHKSVATLIGCAKDSDTNAALNTVCQALPQRCKAAAAAFQGCQRLLQAIVEYALRFFFRMKPDRNAIFRPESGKVGQEREHRLISAGSVGFEDDRA